MIFKNVVRGSHVPRPGPQQKIRKLVTKIPRASLDSKLTFYITKIFGTVPHQWINIMAFRMDQNMHGYYKHI